MWLVTGKTSFQRFVQVLYVDLPKVHKLPYPVSLSSLRKFSNLGYRNKFDVAVENIAATAADNK